MICNVANCHYTQTADIEAFPVCDLHNVPHVRGILEELQRPGHYWSQDRPIVLPVGPLTEEHFEPTEGDGNDPETCNLLADINFNCHSSVLPRYDLTKEFDA